MSLLHTDWYQIKDDDRGKGKWWLIAYLDDASRFIARYGVFDDATTANAISVLERSINRYGTDHGSQFYANFGEIKAFRIDKFQ